MNKITCITINTDASYCPFTGSAGYAFYILYGDIRIKKGGNFKNKPKNSEEAEMMAIGNAIGYLLNLNDLPKVKWLVINSDSLFGMQKIKTNTTPLGSKVNNLRQKLISKLGSKKNVMRHVKSHSNIKDGRSLVNEWCDIEAKKFMNLKRNK